LSDEGDNMSEEEKLENIKNENEPKEEKAAKGFGGKKNKELKEKDKQIEEFITSYVNFCIKNNRKIKFITEDEFKIILEKKDKNTVALLLKNNKQFLLLNATTLFISFSLLKYFLQPH